MSGAQAMIAEGGFGPVLREARRRAGRTQDEIARSLRVQRATISQWETNRHLPSRENLGRLADILDARDELVGAFDSERTRSVAPPPLPAPAGVPGTSLYDVHRLLGRVLVGELVDDERGHPLGWRRDFNHELPPSAFTSASAVRLLVMLQDPPYVDRHALGRSLLAFHLETGGWGTRTIGLRPEATAVVIDALDRLGADFDTDTALAELGALLGDVLDGRTRAVPTYVVTEALSVTARLRPKLGLAEALARALLESRDTTGSAWPEKRPAVEGAIPEISTAHTARAMTVLAHAIERGLEDPDGTYAAAVTRAQEWLEQHADLVPVRENVASSGQPDLEIRHFTPALVVHALASVPDPSWPLLHEALDRVWQAYNPSLGRWQWPNGDVPVWLQLDALRAVTVAHARLTRVPVVLSGAS